MRLLPNLFAADMKAETQSVDAGRTNLGVGLRRPASCASRPIKATGFRPAATQGASPLGSAWIWHAGRHCACRWILASPPRNGRSISAPRGARMRRRAACLPSIPSTPAFSPPPRPCPKSERRYLVASHRRPPDEDPPVARGTHRCGAGAVPLQRKPGAGCCYSQASRCLRSAAPPTRMSMPAAAWPPVQPIDRDRGPRAGTRGQPAACQASAR